MLSQEIDLPRYLSVLPLFGDLDSDELGRLAQGSRLRRLPRGEMVCRLGQPCDEFHVVVVGQVKLFAVSAEGHEKVIELVGPGHSFGEALMFSGRPYVVNAQTLSDSLLLAVGKPAVLAEVERDPRFALRLLANLSRRMQSLIKDVQSDALDSGMQRVVGYLLRDTASDDRAHADKATVALPASKATIASRLSLTPEYFSRVLHELEAAGLIAIDRREIHILDTDRLARYPQPERL